MANEVQVRATLNILSSQLNYKSTPSAYNANLPYGNNPAKGPSPGAITVTNVGVNVNFSQLVQPGLCFIQNLSTQTNVSATDNTGMVEYGIWDPSVQRFHPLGELLPGEFHIIRLSRHLMVEYGTGPGTGTIAGVHTNSLRIRSMTPTPQLVRVDAFDS
jgi:hypothetical protein